MVAVEASLPPPPRRTGPAERLRRASPRWRAAAAFTGGALGALAMPPFGLWPVLFISFPAAVWLIDGAVRRGGARAAAVLGWWFGFGFFLAGLWWLGAAFLVDADEFLWALPLGVIGLPAGLALFTAFGFGLAGALWRDGARRILIFTAALSLSEWLRATVLTGFPWNAWGMAFGQGEVLAQAASLGGLHWLTLLVIFIHAAPATLADGGARARRLAMPAAATLVLAGLAAFGWWRIPAEAVPMQTGVRLRIMQPNVDEAERAQPAFRAAAITRYAAISGQQGADGGGLAGVTHLIWPESAFPFLIDHTPEALDDIARMLPAGTVLITGAARADEPLPGEQRYRYFNSVRVFDSNGASLATYDKAHLVPFGEYLPFDDWLNRLGLRQFVHVPGGFEAGGERRALHVPGLPPVSPLICYEAIFPGEALLGEANEASEPAGLLLNVTNDAWFGATPGPYQHFAQSRLRAIEQGLPMVRAANTGISAVMDPYGREIARLPLGVAGVIDSGLPKPLRPTIYGILYAQAGPALYWLTIICFAIGGLSLTRGQARGRLR
ncbi:MAG: apolipoprotein N-acyltransferase [Pseudochelatococcus sp.]|uniref:apolipoprotein N-acyltransferase n=1 Tax=Pseudochelatococcus sp. TaxID=2020869 RepID=UPI003D927111